MKPINLNQKRKEKARADSRARADANAVKFGTPTSLRKLDAQKKAIEVTRLDGHKRDP
ncbi:DUF4169 family protein [uncultured Litoreibacter sp.]|uniref:DUF4169 family protein n=1 Tax=uncultured Litoreibacter sp. TaxID=1392394 RepID=UPI0026220FEC|nr:DUF4169 family protein [uncultured Litoreibacter sp.]